mmetsp:Transcript_53576/g.164786  ORF Transcript_53576/g.164786 Transcript_53576/m.164786 type:complete len:313 (-) Transcript_53576:188-1126(-)
MPTVCLTRSSTSWRALRWRSSSLSICWYSHGMKSRATSRSTPSWNQPSSCSRAKTLCSRFVRNDLANMRAQSFSRVSFSRRMRAISWRLRRSFSSNLRFSAASRRCDSSTSSLRRCSNSICCWRISSTSSSWSTSSIACSSVLPTMTSRTGSTSVSKSKRSPGWIWVSMSRPVLNGTYCGVGGRSSIGSVWVSVVISSGLSLSSSRYCSVWMSMCLRPSTASGVAGRRRFASSLAPAVAPFLDVASCRFRRCSASFSARCSSACAESGSTCAAYVLPRTTRRSFMRLPLPAVCALFGSRYAPGWLFGGCWNV